MLRYCLILACALGLSTSLYAQPEVTIPVLENYLQELQTATKENTRLWGKDLYAPLLLVNPSNRQVFATHPDAEGLLKRQGNIFTGSMPPEVNLANTALSWAGERWAMVVLPLPAQKEERLNLLTHELFHRMQPELGFRSTEASCTHLDQKEGRIWLRLELEALLQAVAAQKPEQQLQHLHRALLFRQYRHQLFAGSDSTENLLELNEGLAEYTGLRMSNRSHTAVTQHLQQSQHTFLANPTFTRSFAYHTIPAYGYLLLKTQPEWHRQITSATNLQAFFRKAFALPPVPSAELKHRVTAVADQYNYQKVLQEEEEREQKQLQLLAHYRILFLDQPHLELPFEQMNISFDPRNLVPLDDKGTVYPNLRISDNWGILSVEKGALVSAQWDKVILSAPTKVSSQQISGDGWLLELKNDYLVQPIKGTANFTLKRKEN